MIEIKKNREREGEKKKHVGEFVESHETLAHV